MASRLLTRSKTLTRALLHHRPSLPVYPVDVAPGQSAVRFLHSLPSLLPRSQTSSSFDHRSALFSFSSPPPTSASPTVDLVFGKTSPRLFSAISKLHQPAEKEMGKIGSSVEDEAISESNNTNPDVEVTLFSPLEAKARSSGLAKESTKIKTAELSQKLTFALIPLLILVSKSSLPTTLLILSVYWQIYGYLKEIFLDYVHHDVTRTWVLVYLKVLLLILVKDTILDFGLF